MKSIKVVLVGDGAVGKTCTLISYTSNSFPQDYVPTIFDNYSANVNVGTETISLGLWDTAGPEDYDRLRPLSYPQTSIFIAMFSVLSRVSFSNITTKWVPEIKHHCPNVPIILVGNKIDLYNDPETLDRLRGHGVTVVTEQEAKDLAAEISIDIGAPCIYCPSSALTQEGLKSVFETAMKLALFGDSNEPEEQKKCLIQ